METESAEGRDIALLDREVNEAGNRSNLTDSSLSQAVMRCAPPKPSNEIFIDYLHHCIIH